MDDKTKIFVPTTGFSEAREIESELTPLLEKGECSKIVCRPDTFGLHLIVYSAKVQKMLWELGTMTEAKPVIERD